MTCSEKCWTTAICPVHEEDMDPFGRDSGDYPDRCCEESFSDKTLNPRHLWSIHDSTRWYSDPDGWTEHEAECERCNPGLTDD